MVLKELEYRAARPFALRLRGVKPHYISFLSLLSAFFAGLSIIFGHFGISAILLFACISLDALDGAVAKISGRASRLGDLIDHVSDRYADLWILSSIALQGEVPLWVSLLAITGVALTSYMGVQAQALMVGRLYTGLMARAFRYLYLISLTLLRHLGFRVLYPGILLFGALAHATAIQRVAIVASRLRTS